MGIRICQGLFKAVVGTEHPLIDLLVVVEVAEAVLDDYKSEAQALDLVVKLLMQKQLERGSSIEGFEKIRRYPMPSEPSGDLRHPIEDARFTDVDAPMGNGSVQGNVPGAPMCGGRVTAGRLWLGRPVLAGRDRLPNLLREVSRELRPPPILVSRQLIVQFT